MQAPRLARTTFSLVREALAVYITLLKILIPALLAVKLLEYLGMTTLLSQWLSPLMAPLGLPESLSMV